MKNRKRMADLNPLIDHSVLHELQLSVGQQSLPLILTTFVEQGEITLQQIESNPASHKLQTICHSLKSSAASIGAIPLAHEAAHIDQCLKRTPGEPPDTSLLQKLLRNSLIALNTILIH